MIGSVPRFADLIVGVRFVFQNKMMLGAMTLDMFAVLLGGCTFLLPIFAKDLGGGAGVFGLLRAAPSIGAITMALIIAHTPPVPTRGARVAARRRRVWRGHDDLRHLA